MEDTAEKETIKRIELEEYNYIQVINVFIESDKN